MTITATQDTKTLKIEGANDGQEAAFTVNLDGTPAKNDFATPYGKVETVALGKWDASTFRHHTEGVRRRSDVPADRALDSRYRREGTARVPT
jgi:hypothetical protein